MKLKFILLPVFILMLCALSADSVLAQTINTYAGNSTAGYTGDGSAATAAELHNPYCITADGSGNVFIADQNNNCIRKINASGIISTIAGTGTAGYNGDGIAATTAQLNGPTGVAVDGSGNVYIADENNQRIRVVNTSGTINTIAGTGNANYSGDGGAAVAAEIHNPWGVAVDGSGNIYFTDQFNQRIRVINTSGGISTFAGSGTAGFSGDGGAATAANMYMPAGIAIDGAGNVYFADVNNQRIRVVSGSGVINTVAGNGSPAFSGDGSAATAASLNNPYGVSTDGSGNIYIADLNNNRVRKVNATGVISTIAGNGISGYAGDGGYATSCQLYLPASICLDGSGNVYIADYNNNCIREIIPAGLPGITGTATVCAGATTTLSNAASGGAWTSSNTSIATVGAATGIVAGAAGGTATISYTTSGTVTTTVTVTAAASGGTITGTTAICSGSSTSLSNTTPGGIWSSSDVTVATVGSTGTVTKVSTGTATISYTVTNSCGTASASTTVTFSTSPSAGTVTGTKSVCAGAMTTLSDATPGGVWSSNNTAIATTGSTGIVTGVSAGTTTISYTVTNACGSANALATVTINALPSAGTITGGSSFCAGGTITLTDGVTGGAWSTSNPSAATVNSSGVVTGVAAGAAIISYKVTKTCGVAIATATITVDGSTATIAAPNTMLNAGYYVTFAGTATGGTWTSSNTSVATIGCGGQVFGSGTGTATITYTISNSCGTASATQSVTINNANCTVPYIYTIAGNGATSFSGNGTPATSASMNNPTGVTVDANNNVYITDKSNNRVRKITPSGIITTFAGIVTIGFAGDGGPATNAKLSGPSGVCVDPSGNVYIADYNNNRIRKVNTSGTITTFAGIGSAGYSGDSGLAQLAELHNPIDVQSDKYGNIYVVDFNNSAIREISTTGIITTIAGTGTPGFSGDGGPATAAQLYQPTAITVDCSGNIYIDDENNSRIRKINTSGIISTFAGIGTDGFSGDGGPATAAEINEPYGVCVDAYGNVFIGDRDNSRIRIVNTSGYIYTYAGNGTRGFAGDNGPAVSGELYLPYGVAIDGRGNLYIADNVNERIRKVGYPDLQPITGNTVVCEAATTTLSDATTGGTWTSGNTTVATVNVNTGVVTGVAAGTTTITYKFPSTCTVTMAITVNPIPAVITGTTTICGSTTTTLSDATPAGLWSSSNISVVNVGSSTGITSGISTGSSTISYTLIATGCSRTVTYTVNQVPTAAPTNNSPICYGQMLSLNANSTAATTWSWTGPGFSASTQNTSLYPSATATYSLTVTDGSGFPGCSPATVYTVAATVNVLPSISAGAAPNPICAGSNLVLSSLPSSGSGSYTSYSWIGPNGFTATTQNSGITAITTAAAGVYSVTVTDNNGCISPVGTTSSLTVNPYTGGTITGTTSIAVGGISPLSDAISSGVWSCSNTAIASIGTDGVVSGIVSGTATISYTVTNICGSAYATTSIVVLCARTITTFAGNGINGYTGDGGSATAAELNYPISVAVDCRGNVYIPDWNNNLIRKVSTAGVITTIAGNGTAGFSGDGGPATSAELNYPTGVAVDANCNVYVCDWNNQRIRKINTNGTITTIAGNGTAGFSGDGGAAIAAELNYPQGVAVDGSGNVYIADWNNQRIRKIGTNGNISTIAGNGSAGYSGDGGSAISAKLNYPQGVIVDASKNVYIADWNNQRIRQVSPTGIITTIAGNGTAGFSGDGGPATAAEINFPQGIAMDASGNLYIADWNNERVREVSASGIITTLAGNGTYGYSGDGGIATLAELLHPSGIAIDGVGNVYIADRDNNRIREVNTVPPVAPLSGALKVSVGCTTQISDLTPGGTWSSSNTTVATITSGGVVSGIAAGTVTISYSVSNSCGTSVATGNIKIESATVTIGGLNSVSAGFYTTMTGSPSGGTWSCANTAIATLGCTNSGQVFGAAAGTATVTYTITTSCGTAFNTASITVNSASCTVPYIYTVAGNGSTGYTGDGGAPATTKPLNNPVGVGLDANGNLYIADKDDNRIRKVSPTGLITTIAGNGTAGFSGDGGPATAAKLNAPTGVCADANGNVYIADYNNNRIRMINTSGVITTFAGDGNAGYSGDGSPAVFAEFNSPIDVVADFSGNIFVVDFNNSAIREINAAGNISTVAGNGTSGFSGDGGPATAAKLYHPTSMAVDCSGDLFIDDENNVRIREVNTSGTITTIAGIGTDGYSGDSGPATAAQLNEPYGVCVDAFQNVFIGDRANSRIRVINPSGNIYTFGGNGTRGFTGDNGPAVSGEVYLPYGVAVDGRGNLYIADNINERIRRISYPVLLPITGNGVVCQASTTALSDGTTGGSWSTSNTSIATVGSSSGLVTGVSAGTVTITYKLGTSCTATSPLTVNPLPASITGTATICGTTSTTLSDATLAGAWSSSNTSVATIGSGTGVVNGIATGTSTITFTIIATGCRKTATYKVKAVPAASPTNNGPICAGKTAIFSANSTSATTWSWTGPGFSSSAQNPTTVPTITGTYSVTVTDGSGFPGCSPSTIYTTSITVNSVPTVTATATPNPICAGNDLALNSSPTGGSGVYTAYAWKGPNSFTSTVQNAGITGIASTGAGVYSVTVTDNNGCVSTTAKTTSVVVKSLPTITATATPNPICSGSDLTLNSSPSGGSGTYTVYSWAGPNSFTAAAQNTAVTGITASGAGVYSVTVTDNNGCTSATGTTTSVTVNDVPEIINVPGTGLLCTAFPNLSISDATPGGAWSSSNTSVATVGVTGANDATVTAIATGTATITYTQASNSCYITASISVVSSCSGGGFKIHTDDTTTTQPSLPSVNSVSSFPNPTTGAIIIDWKNQEKGSTAYVMVRDIIGQQVYSTAITFNQPSGQTPISIAGLADGTYILTVTNDKISYTSKILKIE